jgi:hypothetical protein
LTLDVCPRGLVEEVAVFVRQIGARRPDVELHAHARAVPDLDESILDEYLIEKSGG